MAYLYLCILCNYVCILDICIHTVPCNHIQCFFNFRISLCLFQPQKISVAKSEGISWRSQKSPCHFPTQVESGDVRCRCFSSPFFSSVVSPKEERHHENISPFSLRKNWVRDFGRSEEVYVSLNLAVPILLFPFFLSFHHNAKTSRLCCGVNFPKKTTIKTRSSSSFLGNNFGRGLRLFEKVPPRKNQHDNGKSTHLSRRVSLLNMVGLSNVILVFGGVSCKNPRNPSIHPAPTFSVKW